jgi:phosphonatase-like hydrolase
MNHDLELDLVIFDIMGTTVADHGEVPAAFSAALAGAGIAVSGEQIKGVRGASKRQALLRLIPPGPEQARLADAAYICFKSHLAERYATAGVQPVTGAAVTFLWLRQHGVRVALNTGFDRETTGLLLAALGWNGDTVDAVICGDEVAQGRPAPYLIFHAMEAVGASSVHRVATVGDTAQDLWAGYHAGVRWNIGVLSGAHDRATLQDAPHTHLLPSVAQVPGLWAEGLPA